MNIKLKTIFSKEVRIIRSKKYLFSLFFGFILLIFAMYFVFDNFLSKIDSNSLTTHSLVQIMTIFLIIVAVFTFIMQYLFETNREKIDKRLEFMLTSPVSVIDIFHGKLLSILFLYYAITVSLIMIMLIMLSYFNMNVLELLTIETWVMIFLILPFFMTLYASFMIWFSFRFTPNMNMIFGFLNYILYFIIIFSVKYLKRMGIVEFFNYGLY
ncbi:MAG: hypothetical protein LBD03_06260 [Methanobrevibacter sp.]|jgi:ABC-type Na+ efflux pump permease subunit|nr:hypothetical protein [Candidatus Methanovirga procula]